MIRTLPLLAALLLPPPASARLAPPPTAPQSIQCGLQPLPPLGCHPPRPVCVCPAEGRCAWLFLGCQ